MALDGDDLTWLRPHPLTVVINALQAVRDLIVPIGFVLFQANSATDFIGLVAVAAPFVTGLVRYLTTRYALSEAELHLKYGVLRRHHQVLPRRNIQNVSTTAGLVARATGLVELTVSDASAGGDIELRLLAKDEADRLLGLLRGTAVEENAVEGTLVGGTVVGGTVVGGTAVEGTAVVDGSAPGTFAPPSSSPALTEQLPPIHSTRFKDLLIFTVASSPGFALASVVLIVTAAVAAALPEFRSSLITLGSLSALGVLGAVFLPVVAPLLSQGGFRLWSEPDRLRIKAGLLTEVQMSARRERMQLVMVNHHLFTRRLGLESVMFETADVEAAAIHQLMPAGPLESWPELASNALGEVEVSEADLQRVSPLTERRQRFRFFAGWLLTVPIMVAGLVATEGSRRPILAAVLVIITAIYGAFGHWYSARRADRIGWAQGNNQFFTRTDVIGERLHLIRKDKIQILRLRATFFQRRLGLASIFVGTAGTGVIGTVELPDLPVEQAWALLQDLSRHSARTPLELTL